MLRFAIHIIIIVITFAMRYSMYYISSKKKTSHRDAYELLRYS